MMYFVMFDSESIKFCVTYLEFAFSVVLAKLYWVSLSALVISEWVRLPVLKILFCSFLLERKKDIIKVPKKYVGRGMFM